MLVKDFVEKYKGQTNTDLFYYAVERGYKALYSKTKMPIDRELKPEILLLGMAKVQDQIGAYSRAKLIGNPDPLPFVIKRLDGIDFDSAYPLEFELDPGSLESYMEEAVKDTLSDSRAFSEDLVRKFDKAVAAKEYIRPADLIQWVKEGIDDNRWKRGSGAREKYHEAEEFGEPNDDMPLTVQLYKLVGEELREIVRDQDAAIDAVIDALSVGAVDIRNKNGPKATFLFTGPPGCGKTLLARNLARRIDRPFKEISMTTYADANAYMKLIGHDKNYKAAAGGELTTFLYKHPNAVVLFDEIEKAHQSTIYQFLSALDGGYLHDDYEEWDVDCTKAIFIFTTNAGRELYDADTNIAYSQQDENAIRDALSKAKDKSGKEEFPPELLSRLSAGCIIPFSPLGLTSLCNVIRKNLEDCAADIKANHGIVIHTPDNLAEYLLCTGGLSQDARIAAGKSRFFLNKLVVEAINEMEEKGNNLTELTVEIDADTPIAKAGNAGDADPDNDKTLEQFLTREGDSKDSRIMIVDYARSGDEVKRVFGEENVCYEFMIDCYNEESFTLAGIPSTKYFDAIFVNPYYGSGKKLREDGSRSSTAKYFLSLLETGYWKKYIKEETTEKTIPPVWLVIIDDEVPEQTSEEETGLKQNTAVKDILHIPTRSALPRTLKAVMSEEDIPANIPKLIRQGKRLKHEQITVEPAEKAAEACIATIKGIREVYALDSELGQTMVRIEHPEGGFDSIYGAEEAKDTLRDYIAFLKDPDKWYRKGLDAPKGVLFWGDPGTGKTKLARTLAGEVQCPFYQTTGSDIINHMNNQKADEPDYLTQLFTEAKKHSPSILFIDEIEVAGGRRQQGSRIGDITVNKLLTEMDGFVDNKNRPVLVIAATNYPWSLDSALRRRFDNEILVPRPSREAREKYLQALRDNNGKLAAVDEHNMKTFLERTAFKTIADIDRIIKLAQRKAIREWNEQEDTKAEGSSQVSGKDGRVTSEILLDALEEFMYGIKRGKRPDLNVRTAFHEIGHAILTKLYRGTIPFVTIVSRGNFGGYSALPEQEIGAKTRQWLGQEIQICLAGRECERLFAEEIKQIIADRFGGTPTNALPDDYWMNSGASQDLEDASKAAIDMVCIFGMEGLIPLPGVSLRQLRALPQEYRDAIQGVLDRERENCVQELEKHRPEIKALAEKLIDNSYLNDEEFDEVLNMQ